MRPIFPTDSYGGCHRTICVHRDAKESRHNDKKPIPLLYKRGERRQVRNCMKKLRLEPVILSRATVSVTVLIQVNKSAKKSRYNDTKPIPVLYKRGERRQVRNCMKSLRFEPVILPGVTVSVTVLMQVNKTSKGLRHLD